MKEQIKILEKELNKMETSNLSDAETKILVTNMFNGLRGRIDVLNENFNKEIRNIKTKIENKKWAN